MPPVSTTQGELVAKFAAGVVDTIGKFAAGVIDTGGNLHLDLRISSRIFEQNRNDPKVIFKAMGEGDSWKKPEAKNLVTLSKWRFSHKFFFAKILPPNMENIPFEERSGTDRI